MTILQIFAALFIGMVILVFGVVKKKKWAMIVSAVFLLIAVSQIVILGMMALY